MNSLAHYIAAGIAVLCFISLYRGIVGPYTEDRLIAGSVIGTKAVLVMVTWSVASATNEFIDVALVCVLLGFVATIAVLKGVYRGHLG